MCSSDLDIIAGSQGFKRHNAATVTGVSYDSVVPQEDTIFTSFSVQGDNEASGTNVLTTRGMSGVTFKQGAFLPAGKGYKIVGFVISSGSVIAY